MPDILLAVVTKTTFSSERDSVTLAVVRSTFCSSTAPTDLKSEVLRSDLTAGHASQYWPGNAYKSSPHIRSIMTLVVLFMPNNDTTTLSRPTGDAGSIHVSTVDVALSVDQT